MHKLFSFCLIYFDFIYICGCFNKSLHLPISLAKHEEIIDGSRLLHSAVRISVWYGAASKFSLFVSTKHIKCVCMVYLAHQVCCSLQNKQHKNQLVAKVLMYMM